MAKEKYDYTKVGPCDYEYYGFHRKSDRIHIDTKRIIKLGYKDTFPDALFDKPRNTHYFIPARKSSDDYFVNVLRGKLSVLLGDWKSDYQEIIRNLKSPEKVYEDTRMDALCYTSDADDLDDIEVEARMASIQRRVVLNRIVQGIHLQYLQRIFVEYFRALLIVVSKNGYVNNDDFGFGLFCQYVQKKLGVSMKANPLYKLPHFKYFDALNKIDNFLKHNTVSAYNALANNAFERDEEHKKYLASFVISEAEAKRKYENGMFAGDWLKINQDTVNSFLRGLFAFSEELCQLLYGEDPKESHWNSDEDLVRILRENFFDIYY